MIELYLIDHSNQMSFFSHLLQVKLVLPKMLIVVLFKIAIVEGGGNNGDKTMLKVGFRESSTRIHNRR